MLKGFVFIDKPKGMKSLTAVLKVKRMLKAVKAGHAGTLDPNATGLLIIGVGEGAKALGILAGMNKEYVGVMRVHRPVERETVEKIFEMFTGVIEQVPPKRSAVSRKKRRRKVYSLEVVEIKGRDVVFRVKCEAGTYIRKLVHDMGKHTGGAHLAALRRVKIGPFSVKEAFSLEEAEKRGEKAITGLNVVISRTGIRKINVSREKAERIWKSGRVCIKESGNFAVFYKNNVVALKTEKRDGRWRIFKRPENL